MSEIDYDVVEINGKNPWEKRYVVVDKNGAILDDAQGYGYKNKKNAHKAMWYKVGGGKKKIEKSENEYKKFIKNNKKFVEEFEKLLNYNVKEIYRKEITSIEILESLENELEIIVPESIRKFFIYGT